MLCWLETGDWSVTKWNSKLKKILLTPRHRLLWNCIVYCCICMKWRNHKQGIPPSNCTILAVVLCMKNSCNKLCIISGSHNFINKSLERHIVRIKVAINSYRPSCQIAFHGVAHCKPFTQSTKLVFDNITMKCWVECNNIQNRMKE